MANNGDDLIDFLMKSIFQLFTWIFLGIFKLIWIIVSAIFKGIVSLFRKDPVSETRDAEKEHNC